MTISLPIQ